MTKTLQSCDGTNIHNASTGVSFTWR